ncbi:MAG: metallophosphoesterase [Thermodesulfobacteriota bacterium]
MNNQFIIFLSIFFSVYGLVHFYIYRKIISQTDFPCIVKIAIIAFIVLMVTSPILSRTLMVKHTEGVGYILTLVSSFWIGFVLYLFLINVGVDLINISGKLISRAFFGRCPALFIPESYPTFFSIILIVMGICTYAYFEALNIGITRVSIQTSKLPENVEGLVIAQISDVHLGVLVGEKRLKKVIHIIREIEPDILFSTGDLVDGNLDSMKGLAEEFRGINPKFGKYAVTGNHEFYAGIERSVEFTEDSGFKLLRNQYVNLNGIINLIGLDDPTAERFKSRAGEDISRLFSRCNPDLFTVFLCHQPGNFRENALFMPIDLQLSGHTHKGQLFPFNLITHIFFPLQGGLFEVNGRKLYASRGTGTWGPPLRFLSPPEIVVIRLENVKTEQNGVRN